MKKIGLIICLNLAIHLIVYSQMPVYEGIYLNRSAWPFVIFQENGTSVARIQGNAGFFRITSLDGGTTHFSVNSTNGYIGFGIPNPGAKLDIGGGTPALLQAIFTRGGSDNNFRLTAYNGSGTAGNTEHAWFGMDYNGNKLAGISFVRGLGANGWMNFQTGIGTNAMTIDNNGNIGIGTTNTNEPLEIGGSGRAFFGNGAGSNRAGLLIAGFDGSYGTCSRIQSWSYPATANPLIINPQGGNVGIGTTTTNEPLEVGGSGRAFFGNGAGNARAGLLIAGFDGSYGNCSRIQSWSYPGTAIPLIINPQGGNVGIGTTSPNNKIQIGVVPSYSGNQFAVGDGTNQLALFVGGIPTFYSNNNFSFMPSGGGNGNVGIGTTNPGANLEVSGVAARGSELMLLTGTGAGGGADNVRKGLTINIPAGVNSASLLDTLNGTTPIFRVMQQGSVGIGTTTPNSAYKLDVLGKIRAQEVIINLNAPAADFVFDNNYKLRSLNEVETFVKENKHLPDIASASEMQTNGVGVSEMQNKLLQKVEELTLYVIEQNKKIETQSEEINELKKELSKK